MAAWCSTALVCLLVLVACTHAQWKGSLGGSLDRYNWRVNSRLAYQRRNMQFHVGGHYGKGGSWGANVGFKWTFGRKRRSMEAEVAEEKVCSGCVHVVESSFNNALAKLNQPKRADYAILAGFSGVFSSKSEDVLSFKVETVLREPSNFNSTDDKEFDIIAQRPACSVSCLSRVQKGTYLIGGSLFNGQMIVYDTIVHLNRKEE